MNNQTEIYILIACAMVFYILAGIAINPLILWTSLPLYVSFVLIQSAKKLDSTNKRYSRYGFIIASVGFSLFYHLTWFFDWQGTKTGSLTSALIFIFMPIYAVLLGFIGLLVGKIIAKVRGYS